MSDSPSLAGAAEERAAAPVGEERQATDLRDHVGAQPLSDVAGTEASTAWAMVEASPDALVMVDEQGIIQLVNRQTEVLFGYDRDELLGRPVELLLPEQLTELHSAHRTRFRVAPEVRAMGSGKQLLARHADGTEIPVEVSLSPMRANGELRVIAAVRDISDRLLSEAFDLEVRHGLDIVEDGVFMFAADTLTFIYVNEGATKQTGYSRDELLAMTPLHLQPEFTEGTFRELLAPVMADEVPSLHFTTVHRPKDGGDVPVEIVLQVPKLERLAKTRSCVALVRNITERLEYEEKLAAIQLQASVLDDRDRIGRDMHDKVIGRLFATGMGVQATLGRITDPEAHKRLTEVVDEIDASIKEIRTTIYGVKSQIDWGQGARGQILAIAAGQSEVLGFEPTVHLDGSVDDLPDAVVDELLGTLGEALTNIGKHADAATVDIDVTVTNSDATLRIADDGVGFSPESSSHGTSALMGHGLANMITRAENLGGTATISSSPGQGTIIDWAVPISRPPDAPRSP